MSDGVAVFEKSVAALLGTSHAETLQSGADAAMEDAVRARFACRRGFALRHATEAFSEVTTGIADKAVAAAVTVRFCSLVVNALRHTHAIYVDRSGELHFSKKA